MSKNISFLTLFAVEGKSLFFEMPAHHTTEQYLDEYLDTKGFPFRSSKGRSRVLTVRGLNQREALAMIKQRVLDSSLSDKVNCHMFRATGITEYLRNGGTMEKARLIAVHESPRTTKLYDRANATISLDEIERIRI